MVCPSEPTWMIGKDKTFQKYSQQHELDFVIFDICPDCKGNMAAVPQGAFAAKKVRKNEEKRKEFFYNTELNPTNYNSKYMDSIWGQYNRYSVHNLKKIMDDTVRVVSVNVDKRSTNATQSVEKPTISTEIGSVGSTISFSSNNIYN